MLGAVRGCSSLPRPGWGGTVAGPGAPSTHSSAAVMVAGHPRPQLRSGACPRASWGHSRHTQLTGHPAVISGDTSPDMARDLNSNPHPTRSRTLPGQPLLPAEPKSALGQDWGVNLEARQPGGLAWGWGAASVPSPGRRPQKPRLQTHPVRSKAFRAGDWIQPPAGPCRPEGAAPVMGPCSRALQVV